MKTDYIAENMLIALLAVNHWTADRVFPLTENFRDVGLLNFTEVSALSVADIAERLSRAGYSRGDYMNELLATRVKSMARVLTADELNALKQLLVEGRTADVTGKLRTIKGVGPQVLETFWALQNTD